jgi:CubicO group peptidase (beta-lactamase class C family)
VTLTSLRHAKPAHLALLLTLSACLPHRAPYVNPHRTDSIGSVRTMYDGKLSADAAVRTFRNIDRLFPSRIIARGSQVTPLPTAAQQLTGVMCADGARTISLNEYMTRNRVSGLLVLHNGQVALERYALGSTSETHWMSMSMAKSITSTLIGIAIHDGKISGVDDMVTTYVPALRGSAYDGVSVRNVLMMASGVRWNETYTDPTSDRRRLLDVQIAQQPGAAIALMAALPRAAAAGSAFRYSTGETLVAGEVVRGAVGMSLAQYLSQRIWKPLGMESDATWWLDSPNGHEIGGSGISATLRDYGRFGLWFMRGGMINGVSVLPDLWLRDAGSPTVLTGGARQPYGYMWWPVEAAVGAANDGAFAAQGIFGQWLYINPRRNVVIVQLAAQTTPTDGDVVNPEACFGVIAAALSAR